TDAACVNDVSAVDPNCAGAWPADCVALAEGTFSCQECIAPAEASTESYTAGSSVPVAVKDGLFDVVLGGPMPLQDGPGPGTYTTLGDVFRDFDVVYVEVTVNGEALQPWVRIEGAAYAQNSLLLQGMTPSDFLDTGPSPQTKSGPLILQDALTVHGNVSLGGQVDFNTPTTLHSLVDTAYAAISGAANLSTVTASGDLSVGTTSTLGGTVTANSDLVVGGNTTLNGPLEFPDHTSQSTASVPERPDLKCFDATNRFVDCGNGTVTDTVTGLIWLKDAGCLGTADWPTAIALAAGLGDGDCGLTDKSRPGDWRLPTKAEWQAILDQANTNLCSLPSFPDTLGTGCCGTDPCVFTGVLSNSYWSSTTVATVPGDAWSVSTALASQSAVAKTGTGIVWPVRATP
ncbi:MAG TPA: DUF1566 domain-containing protein, partial [Candidatus Polarisedimenticolia bacterium]|nr:DUF1566 domain-containing protein [Candidatus Polarisedimenticolia bacterium]